jgi:Uma2 family endonuclease
MSATIQQEIGDRRTVLYKLTVARYHKMIAAGLLPEGEPLELLEGNLVRKDRSHEGENPMTVGHQHAYVVMKLANLNPKLQRLGCHLRPQQPLTLPPFDEPEPDAAIVRGAVEDYSDHHPSAKDVLCVIEVADSSLRRDRTTKSRIYSSSGVSRYLILNLVDRVAEVYTGPFSGKGRYGKPAILTLDQSIDLPAPSGKRLTIPLQSLLG